MAAPIERLSEIITNSHSAVFLGGAGVSTQSGLPDFRSQEARSATEADYGVPPETLLSSDFFAESPEVFYHYLNHTLINPPGMGPRSQFEAKPNAAHLALAAWEEAGYLTGVATQNIDGLHQEAGSHQVWELHGNRNEYYCLDCETEIGLAEIVSQLDAGVAVPQCDCGGIFKPRIVLYGEDLPAEAFSGAADAITGADTLIIGGTSLTVQPASSLVNCFRGENLVVVNQEPTYIDYAADLIIRQPIADVFEAAQAQTR